MDFERNESRPEHFLLSGYILFTVDFLCLPCLTESLYALPYDSPLVTYWQGIYLLSECWPCHHLRGIELLLVLPSSATSSYSRLTVQETASRQED